MLQTTASESRIQPGPSLYKTESKLPPWIDVIAFSPTAWDNSYDRPRQLMLRCAKDRRIFFFEPPKFDAPQEEYLELKAKEGVQVVIPHLRSSEKTIRPSMRKMISLLFSLGEIHRYIFWYFYPQPICYTDTFHPKCVVYDRMNEPSWLRDEISPFFADCEKKLRSISNLIFTSDLNLYLETSQFHPDVHLFVDADNPTLDDWDLLWQQMNPLIQRSLKWSVPVQWLEPGA
jgi:UDP-galactopyranose mutase